LIVSTARSVPWCDDVPRLASLPVRHAYSPMGIVSWAEAARAAAAARAEIVREMRIVF